MREITEGKTYKHFKGNYYKVLHIAFDAESDDINEPIKLVVYKSNHDDRIWVRSYDNFASKVDKEKYPNAEQEYRFMEVD